MDLYTLDNNWFPNALIEGYSDLIWTERHRSPGDFELRSNDITGMLTKLPKGTWVANSETKEVFRVESRQIDTQNNVEQIVIKGSSILSFLDLRPLLIVSVNTWFQDSNTGFRPAAAGTPSQMIQGLINIAIGGTQITNATMPGCSATNSVSTAGETATNYVFEEASILKHVTDLMNASKLGIRSIRPAVGSSGCKLDVYRGVDRSTTVVFNSANGDFIQPSYLDDNNSYINAVIQKIQSPNLPWTNPSVMLGKRYLLQDFIGNSGFNLRLDILDSTNVSITPTNNGDISPSPDPTQVSAEWAAQAKAAIADKAQIELLDGKVNPGSALATRTLYDLGDKVLVKSPWGIDKVMYVSEYIYSKSVSSGESAYPTLASIT